MPPCVPFPKPDPTAGQADTPAAAPQLRHLNWDAAPPGSPM